MEIKLIQHSFNQAKCGRALWCLGFALSLLGCSQTPVAEIAEKLNSEDHEVRYDALKNLEDYGPESREALDELVAALTDPAPKVRYRSAKVLSKIGIGAAPAVDAVTEALKEADQEMRYYLVKTLANIEDDAVVALEELTVIVEDENDARTRYYAAKALGKLGKEARSSIPALEKAEQDSDPKVRKAAVQALEKVKG